MTHDQICDFLREMELEKKIKILYAAEAGNRAWGFDSPDSGHDVFAIYVNPEAWYLSIEEKPRDKHFVISDELNILALELRKALQLFAKGDPTLYERLDSATVYAADIAFFEKLRDLIPYFFNSLQAIHYYLEKASHALEDYLPDDRTIAVKEFLLALRGLLAAKWVIAEDTMPPTSLAHLLHRGWILGDLRDEVTRVLAIKTYYSKKSRISMPDGFKKLFETEKQFILRQLNNIHPCSASQDLLDDLFYQTVKDAKF